MSGPKKLQDKVAVITGGTTGIGLATAKLFVKEGAYVFITGRRQKELDEAVRAIGSNITGVQGDIAKLTDLDRLYEVVATKGKIDVVFANAGVAEFAPLGKITEEHFDKLFDINVKGTLFTVQKALRGCYETQRPALHYLLTAYRSSLLQTVPLLRADEKFALKLQILRLNAPQQQKHCRLPHKSLIFDPDNRRSYASWEIWGMARILLVDDDKDLRLSLASVLEHHGFEVKTAGNVPEALACISSAKFDVLLSDLHMPGAGDGLTVVSAMRHANPLAVTMLLTSFPEMDAAAQAILLQTDEILVKPMKIPDLVEAIRQRLETGPTLPREVESVATILERCAESSIQDWLVQVELEETIMAVPLTGALRTDHLPQVFRDLVHRLRSFKALGTKELLSASASNHGVVRHGQGYTPSMMVEESRLLQVCIFRTLQNNLATIDFSVLLIGVMTIADEVDSQLSQAMKSFTALSAKALLPA
jgi:CheY-like chemotaxis protein